jgi:hypothetical protein
MTDTRKGGNSEADSDERLSGHLWREGRAYPKKTKGSLSAPLAFVSPFGATDTRLLGWGREWK